MSEKPVTIPDVPIPAELPGGPPIGVLPKPVLVGEPEKPVDTLDLDELFSVKDERFETFELPGWPKPVTIGSSTSRALSEWQAERDRPGEGSEYRKQIAGYRLIAMSWVQPDGSRIPKDKIDVVAEMFMSKDSRNVDALSDRIARMNGMKLGDEVIKNVSSGTTVAASRIGWRPTLVSSMSMK